MLVKGINKVCRYSPARYTHTHEKHLYQNKDPTVSWGNDWIVWCGLSYFKLLMRRVVIFLPCVWWEVCEREIFRLTVKQGEKSGSRELPRFLCRGNLFPCHSPCSSGQPDPVNWTSGIRVEKLHLLLELELHNSALGGWDVRHGTGWNGTFSFVERTNEAGCFMDVTLSLKMLFLMCLFKLVLYFHSGISIACDCRYRSSYR